MEISLLLRLLVAHLLTDFVFQPTSWIENRKQKKIRSGKLLAHVCVTTLVAYMFSGHYTNWFIPITIFVSHYLIDLLKSYLKDNFKYFIWDQVFHLFVIIGIWLTVEDKWNGIGTSELNILNNNNFWLLFAGYVFVSWPLGIIIGKGTQRWRIHIAKEEERAGKKTILHENSTEMNLNDQEDYIREHEHDTENTKEEQGFGLANAGKWIGICERVLILTFVIMNQYTAIGFLMTAKSILRFGDKETNTQLKTEYILVGTLVSFVSAAITGVLIQHALKI